MKLLSKTQKLEAYWLNKSTGLESVPISEIALLLNASPIAVENAIDEIQNELINKGYIKLLSALKNIY